MRKEYIAIIDTETNFDNDVMSIGIVIADSIELEPIDYLYYVIPPYCHRSAMFEDVLIYKDIEKIMKCVPYNQTMQEIKNALAFYNIKKMFAYNATFDYHHIPELQCYNWYDIMKIAANKRFNYLISEDMPCCSSGRLKKGYGVEPILRMLSGDYNYHEIHNALADAVDELKIMKLLGRPIEDYEFGYISYDQ